MQNLINFLSNVEARSSMAHLHQILSLILILSGLLISYVGTVPAEYWVITGTYLGNGGLIFEFLFNRKRNEPK